MKEQIGCPSTVAKIKINDAKRQQWKSKLCRGLPLLPQSNQVFQSLRRRLPSIGESMHTKPLKIGQDFRQVRIPTRKEYRYRQQNRPKLSLPMSSLLS